MKYKTALLLISIIISSCSNLKVEEEDLPDVFDITSSTIVTMLPVINIDADPSEFENMMSSYYDKILVEGEFSTINNSGVNQLIDKKIEFEISGRSSIGDSFPLKSLRVIFDEAIEPVVHLGFIPDEILAGHHLDILTTIRLRNSGNDFGVSMIKDLAYSSFAVQNSLDFELMYGFPVQVFINEDYYGLMNALTENNILGIASLLHLDTSLISILKVKDASENLKYDEGNRLGCEALLTAIEHENAQAIWDNIDIDNFIDYIIYQDYIGNADWANNIKAFNPGNGKFRFILYDVDLAGNVAAIALLPKLEFLSADLGKIYRALQENEGFNDRLEKRKEVLYQGFSVSNFNKIVDDLASTIENDIPYLIAKYGRPESTLHWKIEIEKLKLDFKGRDHSIRKRYDLD